MTTEEPTASRRDILKLGGAAITTGAMLKHGVSVADAFQDTHELVINAPPRGNGAYPYAFSVGGTIRKIGGQTKAPVNAQHVTTDPEDDVDGCEVNGWSAGGYDAYEFTGDLVTFSVPEQWEHKYNVWLDGKKVSASDLQTDDPDIIECGDETISNAAEDDSGGNSEYPSAIHVVMPGPNTGGVFSFGVTGKMQLPSGEVVGDVTANLGGIGVTGNAARLPFSGTLSHMSLTDYDMEVRVVQDGRYG